MPEEIEKLEPTEVVETAVEQTATEEVIKPWSTVDDTPEIHPAFLEQPKAEEVIEEVVEVEEKPIEEKIVEQEVAPLVIDETVILNKSYQEFLETQKDWTAEPKENILLQNLRLENPTLTDKQIERLYQKEYVSSEFADEDEITDKEINIERDYQKGLKLLESQKEKYKVVKGLDESIPEDFKKAKEFADSYIKQQEENKIAFEQTAKDFQSKTDEVFSSNFEGFKVKVGDEEFSIKPDDVQETKSTLSDLSNFDKKFFDESGKLKDPQGYYKALHFAMNPEKVAEHFIKIGMAKQLEIEEKESKNIVVDGVKNIQTGSQIKQWKVLKEGE